MKKYIVVTLLLAILSACSSQRSGRDGSGRVFVSIAPLAWLVEQIADSTIMVEVLVPETTSPETYEPTTAQVQRLSRANLYISTGLIDFEKELARSIGELSDSLRLIDLSVGIEVMEGSCSHGHADHSHHHAHGIDPHTWLSPRLMKGFATEVAKALDEVYPDNKANHYERLVELLDRIDSLDSYIRSSEIGKIAIVHPSLTYFARDYGVEQIAIEIEGKEPSISQMKDLIERLKVEKISRILYQKQTSAAAAETIAREVGAEVVEFDPLAFDWIRNLYFVADQIAK